MSKNGGQKTSEDADAIRLGREDEGLNQEDGSGERDRACIFHIFCAEDGQN